MKKDYTLSYFFNSYQKDQVAVRQFGLEGVKGDEMLSKLSESRFSPSRESVQKILNFAKSYEVLESRFTQHIEVIKN